MLSPSTAQMYTTPPTGTSVALGAYATKHRKSDCGAPTHGCHTAVEPKANISPPDLA